MRNFVPFAWINFRAWKMFSIKYRGRGIFFYKKVLLFSLENTYILYLKTNAVNKICFFSGLQSLVCCFYFYHELDFFSRE